MDDKQTYAVEYRKGTAWNEREGQLYKFMECKLCGQMAKTSEDSISVTCSQCVIEMWEPLDTGYIKSDRPRGWTLMAEFVDKDGNVYHSGKEQPDLKGTLSPTTVEKNKKPSKRMTKREKQELVYVAGLNLSKLKKELAKARWKKDKKILLSETKLHSKIAAQKFPRNLDKQSYLSKYKK